MRRSKSRAILPLVIGFGIAGSLTAIAAEQAANRTSNPTYVVEQAVAGKAIYEKQCVGCHGETLDNGEAPPLMGTSFMAKWGGKSVFDLFNQTRATMPAAAPGSLTVEEYTQVLAYMFQKNIMLASKQPLMAEAAAMKSMIIPAPSQMHGQLEPGIVMPPPPNPTANPLDKISPVTEAMLKSPPDGDWLTWRRTIAATGHSPLKQIDKTNVSRLGIAWSWSLPNGANESTPLVHDGVLFVFGHGDVVQALNAANGDLLWEYNERTLAKTNSMGGQGPLKKAMAIFGTNLYVPTSDGHIVALDVKTGHVVWDGEIADGGIMMTGGPLYAKGKIIIGTGSFRSDPKAKYRGAYIVALDAKTGKEAWRFKTIPGPGEPGGNTWNDLPAEKRSGASVWTPGSYDPDLNTVFFGVAQTYDTGPMRDPIPGSKSTNDGLYTNSTLALDPDTGKLKWYFQHLHNDQWDLDWVFERQVLTLPVNGTPTKVVVTAGKDAIHDVLEAKSGKYLYSIDLGLQNFVKSIDPKTGRREINQDLVPGDGKVKFVCPHVEGAKNWIPSAYNPDTKMIFVPLVESCMYMTPVAPGETGLLSTGVRISLSPRDGSDGLFGRMQAINLETKKTVWTDRQRAPRTSGVLSTSGGLVFAGSLDRQFTAYDDATGKKLWTRRLNEVLNSAPITYAVNGKQYVAVVLGLGGMHSKLYMPLVPEIKNPVNRSSSLWVFELAGN